MWGWLSQLFGKRSDPNGHELYDALSPREKAILQREIAESHAQAMHETGDVLSDATDMTGLRTGTKIDLALKLRTHNGSVPNVGLVSPGPSENRSS